MPFPPHWQLGGVFLTGIGSLVLGVILMVVYRYIAPAFFLGKTLTRDTRVLVAADPAAVGVVRLPDTAEPRIVVPDSDDERRPGV